MNQDFKMPTVESHHSENGNIDIQALTRIADTLREKDLVMVERMNEKKKIENVRTLNNSDYKDYSHYIPTEAEEKIYNMVTRDLTIADNNYQRPLPILGYRTYAESMPYFQRLYLATMYRGRMECQNKNPDIIAKEIMSKGDIFIAYANSRILYPSFEVKGETKNPEDLVFAVNNATEAVCRETEYEEVSRMANTALVYSPLVVLAKTYDYRYIHDGQDKSLDWKTSGHNHEVVDLREMYFADLSEEDVQKQAFIVRKRYIDYSIAKDTWGESKNWKYVKSGYKQTFRFDRIKNEYEIDFINDPDATFNTVEQVSIYYRFLNREYHFVNNVLVCKVDNKMARTDGLYQFEVYRHKTIAGNLMGICLAQDLEQEENYQSFFKTVIRDMALYQVKPPLISIGKQALSPDIWRVGAVHHSTDPNTKVQRLIPEADMNAAITALNLSKNDGQRILSDQLGGQALGTKRTATEIRALEGNLNTFSNEWLLANKVFVKRYGMLILGDILEHDLTVKIDEETNNILNRDITNRDTVVDGEMTDVVIRPVNPVKKMSLKKQTEKLKEAGEFEYLSEIEMLLDAKEEELKSERNKKIVLFDVNEIKGIQFSAICDVEYLANKDRVARINEMQDFVNTWAESGILNLPQIAQEQAIARFGNKGKEYILQPESQPQATGQANPTQVTNDQNAVLPQLQANQ